MKFAVLIAVETYTDSQLKPIDFAGADALALATALEPLGFSAADRLLLVGEEATRSNIESRVKRLLKGLDADDQLIVYYVGRGFSLRGKDYLTCIDTATRELSTTSLEMAWLFQQFQNSDCQEIAFFLDPSESGLPGTEGICHLETESAAFLESSDRCACFAACGPHESSHTSGALQHGIWSHHVVEAFGGRAPAALAARTRLTPVSLQKFLQREVPRMLTKTFASKRNQTPWMAASQDGTFTLANLTEVLHRHKPNSHTQAEQVKSITLVAEQSQGVRSLSGFRKGHSQPDRLSNFWESFIVSISGEEITDDVTSVFSELRSRFRFKRADMHLANLGDGTATIITPFFNYSIKVALDPVDMSQVIFRKTVDAIKEPSQILSQRFADVFACVFDTVEFEISRPIDLPKLIDRIEDLDDDRITIEYDPAATHCSLRLAETEGIVSVTPRSLSIVHPRPAAPQVLLHSFFSIQMILLTDHDIRLLPY